MKQTVDCLFFFYDGNGQSLGRMKNSPDWLVQSGEFAVQSPGKFEQTLVCFISPLGEKDFSLDCLCQSRDCANIPGDGIPILLRRTEQSHRKIITF